MYSECHKTLEELYDIKGVYFLRLPYITLKYVLLLTSVIIKTLTIPLTFFFPPIIGQLARKWMIRTDVTERKGQKRDGGKC